MGRKSNPSSFFRKAAQTVGGPPRFLGQEGARPVPRDWIAEDGMGVTSRFEDYARPLIGGEVSQVYIDGIPRHIESL